jgi:hypothetical protein
MEANMSATDRSVNLTATAKPATTNKRDSPCTKRNTNRNLTDIFGIKVNTYSARIQDSLKSIPISSIQMQLRPHNLISAP